MNFVQAVTSAYKNYVNFSGRSQRSAFWWWFLFDIVISIVIAYFEGGTTTAVEGMSASANYNMGPIAGIWALINVLPGLALSVRRLHDLDKSGWWVLIGLIPLVGGIVLLVWYGSKGTSGTNRFGADPMGPANVF